MKITLATKRKEKKAFLRGMGSAFDLSGSMIREKTSHKSDIENMRSDWERIGSYFRIALNKADKMVIQR